MAAAPTPQPPDQGNPAGGGGVAPAQQQANPLQTALAKLAQVCDQMSQQNPVVQQELNDAKQAFVRALQKTMMAARPQEATTPAPQGQ